MTVQAGLTKCGECREPIRWCLLSTGKRMPLNPDPDTEGTVAAVRDATGRWVGRVLKADEQPDAWERRYMTHFATCRVLLARRQREAAVTRQVPGVPAGGAVQVPSPAVVSMDAYRRKRMPRTPHRGRG